MPPWDPRRGVFLVFAAAAFGSFQACKKPPVSASGPQSRDTVKKTSVPREANQPSAPLSQGDTLLRGKLGSREVIFELRLEGGAVGGRYYDLDSKLSILVGGKQLDQTLELTEYAAAKEAIFGDESAVLSLSLEGEQLVGKRRSLDGKESPLTLSPTEDGSYNDFRNHTGILAWSEDKSFSYRPLAVFEEHWVYCSESAQPPIDPELIPGLHEECFYVFESERGKRAVIEGESFRIESVDARLDASLVGREFGEEMPQPGESWGGEFNAEVIFARGRVLSYSSSTSGLYTAAYPAHNSVFVTIDLRTGQQQTVESLLEIPNEETFAKELERDAPMKSTSPEDENKDCSWLGPMVSPFAVAPHLTDAGLHFTPNLPHVAKACQYENLGLLVPRALAEKYARQGSLLESALAGEWGP